MLLIKLCLTPGTCPFFQVFYCQRNILAINIIVYQYSVHFLKMSVQFFLMHKQFISNTDDTFLSIETRTVYRGYGSSPDQSHCEMCACVNILGYIHNRGRGKCD